MQSRSRAHTSSLNNRIWLSVLSVEIFCHFQEPAYCSRDGEVTGLYPTQNSANAESGCLFLPLLLLQDPHPLQPSMRSVTWSNIHHNTLHWKLTSYTLPCSRSLIWPEMFICAVRNLFILKHGANVHKTCLSLKRFWIVKPWAKSDIEAKLPKAATKLYLCFKSALRAQTFLF